MINNALQTLAFVTAVSSLAILLVGTLRGALRIAVGARATYWLWLLVPASILAVLLPGPTDSMLVAITSSQNTIGTAFYSATASAVSSNTTSHYVTAILAVWLLGALLLLAALTRRQHRFVRSLGKLTTDPDGTFRSGSVAVPMVVGAWRAHLVIPADFETRYSQEERALMLAHERAHVERGDALVNAVAAGCVCLFWFNPLVYWAFGRLQFDQELSCDAIALARSGIGRRRYAETLLKTQLASEFGWHLSVECHWQSCHPLKARIAMLKHPLPSRNRLLAGIVFSIGLTGGVSYSVWATQPEASPPSTPITINLNWSVSDTSKAKTYRASIQRMLVNSDSEFQSNISGLAYEIRCVPSLPQNGTRSPLSNELKSRGVFVDGQILLKCKLSSNGRVFSTPAVVMQDGDLGTIEADDSEQGVQFRLAFTASTSIGKMATKR